MLGAWCFNSVVLSLSVARRCLALALHFLRRIKNVKDQVAKVGIGHLFEAYFTTKGSTGTGMGLFLSHQVIKAHGGTIEVQSEEGKGTEFIVKLPKFIPEIHSGIHKAA